MKNEKQTNKDWRGVSSKEPDLSWREATDSDRWQNEPVELKAQTDWPNNVNPNIYPRGSYPMDSHTVSNTRVVHIKTVERKTGERFILPILVLTLFVVGLIVALINMGNLSSSEQRTQVRASEHQQSVYERHIGDVGGYWPIWASEDGSSRVQYPDAGRRYCRKAGQFVVDLN